jgi:hypothetical protein
MIMKKHIIKLEVLCEKFQSRYGQDDTVVIELKRELDSPLKKKSGLQRWSIPKSSFMKCNSRAHVEFV